MDLGLKDKGIIVMASSSGLGKAVATEFSREGAKVMLFSSSEEKLLRTQAEIENITGNKPEYSVGNITNYDDIKSLVENSAKKLGNIYALFNNTGGPPAGTFANFSDDDWQKAYELTLLPYIRTIREVIPHMKENGGGRILNSTSSSIKAVLDNLILSNTFRMGVLGLSKTLSQELGKDNILVNVIGPGRIATERIDKLDTIRAGKMNVSVEDVMDMANKNIPLGRYGLPEEYGKLAVFLCSSTNTYITGQSILVDGGMVKSY